MSYTDRLAALSAAELLREDIVRLMATTAPALYWLAPGSEGWDRLERAEPLSFDDWSGVRCRIVTVWRACPDFVSVRERALRLLERGLLEAERLAGSSVPAEIAEAEAYADALRALLWFGPSSRRELSVRELRPWLGARYLGYHRRLLKLCENLCYEDVICSFTTC